MKKSKSISYVMEIEPVLCDVIVKRLEEYSKSKAALRRAALRGK